MKFLNIIYDAYAHQSSPRCHAVYDLELHGRAKPHVMISQSYRICVGAVRRGLPVFTL